MSLHFTMTIIHLLCVLILYSKCIYGSNFSKNFLEYTETIPTLSDLDHFVSNLKRTFYFNTKQPNRTDANIAITSYLVTCILQRTLTDNGRKITNHQLESISDLINRGKYYISHYIYRNKQFGHQDLEYKVSLLYKDVDIFVQSINNVSENRLHKWISGDLEMHSFVEAIDNCTLDRKAFLYIVESMDQYNINMTASDVCLSRIIETPEPLNNFMVQPCREDAYCKHCLSSGPSIAYALSHRLLNMIFRRNVRRCFIQSAAQDEILNDQMCAFMYREAVYLARRGFFARDLFLEHVALCGILGYKEFYRMNWFYKATSWIDESGCMQENPNFLINQTVLYKSLTNNTRKKKHYTKNLKKILLFDCHSHPMAVLTVVLANAVRFIAHFM